MQLVVIDANPLGSQFHRAGYDEGGHAIRPTSKSISSQGGKMPTANGYD